MILLILLTPPPDSDDSSPDKVALDDERLPDDAPKGLQKVELDLDDALFLEFEEEEKAPPEAPEAAPEETPTPPAPAKEKGPSKPIWKKLWFLALVGVLLVGISAGGAYFFLKKKDHGEAQNATESNATAENAATSNASAHNATPQTHDNGNATHNATNQTKSLPSVSFAPFEVEYTRNDKIHFLVCKFTVYKVSEKMMLEMQVKSILLRDAVYRYLKNTDLTLLENPENAEQVKKNLATVLNQVLKSGKVNELLFDEYLVK